MIFPLSFLFRCFAKDVGKISDGNSGSWWLWPDSSSVCCIFRQCRSCGTIVGNKYFPCLHKDKEGKSALHISAKKGHAGVMKTLTTKCPETCELLDNKGRTALHLAVKIGNRNAVEIFLKELAFQDLINEQDKVGNTPLHLAAISGHYTMLMMLANDKRVDKWAMNREGWTLLTLFS